VKEAQQRNHVQVRYAALLMYSLVAQHRYSAMYCSSHNSKGCYCCAELQQPRLVIYADTLGCCTAGLCAHCSGMYMPDSISSFQVKGKTYIASANEGESESLICTISSTLLAIATDALHSVARKRSTEAPLTACTTATAHTTPSRCCSLVMRMQVMLVILKVLKMKRPLGTPHWFLN
jgi:hypothetical protein